MALHFSTKISPSLTMTVAAGGLSFAVMTSSAAWGLALPQNSGLGSAPVAEKKIEATSADTVFKNEELELAQLRARLVAKAQESRPHKASLVFDLPVTYNKKVAAWLNYFQSQGKNWFRDWLERASKYMPFLQKELRNAGLPGDLAYMVMIESGFDPYATSPAKAVGPWQFMKETGSRYGLHAAWWLDERRDFKKSTLAAIRYMQDLYQDFGSWYLVAASYNMGENGLRRQIQKHNSKDFWHLSKVGALPQETVDYVPKILAVMLIAKAPSLYGFRDLAKMEPLEYDMVYMQGGTDLNILADEIGITRKALKDMNSELLLGYIPAQVPKHMIRIPRGSQQVVMNFIQNRQKTVTQQ